MRNLKAKKGSIGLWIIIIYIILFIFLVLLPDINKTNNIINNSCQEVKGFSGFTEASANGKTCFVRMSNGESIKLGATYFKKAIKEKIIKGIDSPTLSVEDFKMLFHENEIKKEEAFKENIFTKFQKIKDK